MLSPVFVATIPEYLVSAKEISNSPDVPNDVIVDWMFLELNSNLSELQGGSGFAEIRASVQENILLLLLSKALKRSKDLVASCPRGVVVR